MRERRKEDGADEEGDEVEDESESEEGLEDLLMSEGKEGSSATKRIDEQMPRRRRGINSKSFDEGSVDDKMDLEE